ncbi:hypothetical protein ANCDUO_08328 [Ancylostoma duodenale]|uniref:Uncharacterized protein n=1 Tax=Ancylostoma duodenale TaxID=51022 RepID=A0A0C2DG34_9BILA|nr:hypothetical protein ANCDUO_08328 [Ancylostoma duodenale]
MAHMTAGARHLDVLFVDMAKMMGIVPQKLPQLTLRHCAFFFREDPGSPEKIREVLRVIIDHL